MAFIISRLCVDVRDQSCVVVCPVDCIHPTESERVRGASGDRQLYIDPKGCIDCGACLPECPVSAIFAENTLPEVYAQDKEKNAQYYS